MDGEGWEIYLTCQETTSTMRSSMSFWGRGAKLKHPNFVDLSERELRHFAPTPTPMYIKSTLGIFHFGVV